MKKRFSKRRALVLFVILVLVGWFSVTRDVPAPDLSDLEPTPLSFEDAYDVRDLPPLDLDCDRSAWFNERIGPLSTEELRDASWPLETARELVQRNRELLDQLELAIKRSSLELPEISRPTVIDVLHSSEPLSTWYCIAELIALEARVHLESGDAPKSLEAALRVVDFGDRIQQSQGTLAVWFAGSMLQALGFDMLHRIVEWGELEPGHLRDTISRIDQLSPPTPALQHSLRAEFAELSACIDKGFDVLDRFWEPFFLVENRTKLIFADAIRAYIANVEGPFEEREHVRLNRLPLAVFSRVRSVVQLASPVNYTGRLAFNFVIPEIEYAVDSLYLLQARVAVLRTVLALRCFAMEHATRPPTLSALVPDYLPAIPSDPYDGAPVRYAPDRNLLWLVGEDLKDEGGMEESELDTIWSSEGSDESEPRPGWTWDGLAREDPTFLIDSAIWGTPRIVTRKSPQTTRK